MSCPGLRGPARLEEWLAEREAGRAGILASLAEGASSLREGLREVPCGVARLDVLVGPEGDFSEAEREAALHAGFRAVSLGEVVLRVETAALYALSVIGYELKRGGAPSGG